MVLKSHSIIRQIHCFALLSRSLYQYENIYVEINAAQKCLQTNISSPPHPAMSAFTKVAACGHKENPQLPPYITPILSMLCLNLNIHHQYSNFLSSLRSFNISNTHQYIIDHINKLNHTNVK